MSSVSPLPGDADHGREPPRLARRFDGLAHHLHVPRRLERVVGAEASGLVADPVDDVVARLIACRSRRGAERSRGARPRGRRDDPLGAGQTARR